MSHPAFDLLRSEFVPSLNLTVEEYRHKVTGAQHLHMKADSEENVFLVALRTVPQDSSGVAHILEHTVLCGSKKYPVRDPFFMMSRRSLNTFMNAFTSSDWTAYPFASQNRKDFNNLLDVYLDAVFFSRLDPLDFAQEGHRLEFAEEGNPDSPLVYKGVVYNEMKGAMSSVPSTLWQKLTAELYPTTTYHYNSGGEPECIPDLSYEQLVDFYRTHYHPSNAIFMTFGDIPAEQHQAKFEEQALKHFDALDQEIAVADEQRYRAPLQVEDVYASDDNTQGKTHIVLGWLLGKSTDLTESLRTQLLCSTILDNSASPLQHALETTELAEAPSPLCGLEESQQEMCFVCGVEGSEAEHADAIEAMILSVFQDIAERGIPKEELEASLHQLELHQREVGGDSYPYGLQLILTALSSATHRGDPVAQLDLEGALAQLRQDIQDPDFIKNLARDLFLDNPHRVRLVLKPDSTLDQRKNQAEAEKLAQIKAALNEAQRQEIIHQAQALKERQQQKDDESILPKVGIADVPPELHYVHSQKSAVAGCPLTTYTAGTNGITYQQFVAELPQLSDEELDILPLYTSCLTELGIGQHSYLDTQRWQAQVCGSIHAFASIRSHVSNIQKIHGFVVLSAKGLTRNHPQLCELMQQTLEQVRFDEYPRIKELVAQISARRQQAVVGSGHALAMQAASSGFCPSAQISHRISGLEGIRRLKALDESMKEAAAMEGFAHRLQSIHNKVLAAPKQLLLISELSDKQAQLDTLQHTWQSQHDPSFTPMTLPEIHRDTREMWLTNTQVNFCAKAYPTVSMTHPDAAPLTVLGGFLSNGFLHRAVREQGGAYGGGASQDGSNGAFRFYSYRDPRMEETLTDFDQALHWLEEESHDEQKLEEAILGIIGSIDKPASPAGEAKQTFHAELNGRSREIRETFRRQILQVSIDDLKRVARTYLKPEKASVVVIANKGEASEKQAQQLKLQVKNL